MLRICTVIYFMFYLKTVTCERSVDLCSTLEQTPGNCVEIKYCPPLMNILMKKPVSPQDLEYLKSSSCGFKGIHPKVCCGIDDCLEENFANPLVPIDESTGHTATDLLPDSQNCGQLTEDRLIGGVEAQLGTYPWTALLQYDTAQGPKFHCGGVLINDRYILTAAHCIHFDISINWTLKNVRLGDHYLTSEQDCDSLYEAFDCCCADPYLDIEIDQVIVHDEYDHNTFQHDIALIRLKNNVTYTDFVQPICLEKTSTSANTLMSGTSAIVAGWGVDESGYETDAKSKNYMDIINMSVCEQEYASLRVNMQEQICATTKKSGAESVLYGDSGGALQGWNANAHQFAIGIMSVRHPQRSSGNVPIIYTNVKKHTPWIVANLKP